MLVSGSAMKPVFLLLCTLALGRCIQPSNVTTTTTSTTMSPNLVAESSNSTQQATEEEKENDRKLMEEWTRMFFSMGRVAQQGEQTLVFPGLFNGSSSMELVTPRELRSFAGEASKVNTSTLPVYSVDDQVTKEAVEDTSKPNLTHPSLIHFSNDNRLFANDAQYFFEHVESLDEDQRQRRRLNSAHKDLLTADKDHINTMITTVFTTPRNYATNQTVRSSVMRFLTQKMRSFGLVTGNQIFRPVEFEALFDGDPTPNGTNVIGILPGELWGTKDDQVLVIGAHWDTVPSSGGMDDNGSGVTAVLEVARAMTEGGCRPKHTVIFVAFDLEEVGCLGSIFFVRDFLIRQVLRPHGAKLRGAFILDTIMNYNETQYSQTLSPEWQTALPKFWEDLQAENRTGDFLAVLYRKDADSTLADTLASNWKNDGKRPVRRNTTAESLNRTTRRFRVKNKEITIMKADNDLPVETMKSTNSKYRMKKVQMDLQADVGERLELLTPWIDLLRSDHSRFWYHSIEEYPESLPAVLITDTAPYRGVMQDCYHQECDSASANQLLKFADIQFLVKTCQALIDSIVSLSESKCLFQPLQAEGSKLPRPSGNSKLVYSSDSSATQSSSVLILFGIFLAAMR